MLIKGGNLNEKQARQVLAAYVHRGTIEHPIPAHGGTRIVTDSVWLHEHAFYFLADGSRLDARFNHCVPYYIADWENA